MSCRVQPRGDSLTVVDYLLVLFRCRTFVPLFAVCLAAAATAPAKGQVREYGWTVVTLDRNGAWGAASADLQGHAIAAALRKCTAMAKQPSDCGAEFAIIKGGWVVALRCSGHRVLGTGRSIEDAEKAALSQETALTTDYVPELPLCRRVLTVDPDGVVTVARATLLTEN